MSNLQQSTYAISRGHEYTGWETAPKTLIEVLKRAVAIGHGIAHVKADGSETYQSYEELLRSAERVLGSLRARGLQPGDKVIVEVQDSMHFLAVFWGCIHGGFVPVPMHTPASFDPDSNEMKKTKNVWVLLDEPLLVCDGFIEEKYLTLKQHPLFADLKVATAESLLEHEPDRNYHTPDPDDIAFLQFSSGSTGDAKGVQLTHANLCFNCGSMQQCFEYTSDDVFVSWMPLYHDMGLIGFHLTGIFSGLKQVRMSHETFVRRPELLLRKISEHRGTMSGSPNFGLEWMTSKVNDLSEFDLSSLRVFYNGAEPISVPVKEAFEEKFSACGLKPNVITYTYGMAECCVGATGVTWGDKTDIFFRIDQKQFNRKGIAVEVTDPDVPSLLVADDGVPLPGMVIRIVDENDQVLPEYHVGNIQVKGLNVTSGYYRNPAANANLFCDEWLRTGDLGFIVNGRLAVTGRVKDVIFINGQNFYAHDIEELLIQSFDLQNQSVVAVGFTDQNNGRERVYMFLKYKKVNDQFLKLAQDMKTVINVEMGFEINGVIPIRAIPKTTSGKLERFNLRNRVINGEFDELLEDIRVQLIEKSSTRNDLVMPRTETEKALHKIWSDVFVGVPESAISVTDHFMALGGNSLKAMQMVRELEVRFGISDFDLIKLFENATIEQLATHIEELKAQGSGEAAAPKLSIREVAARLKAGEEKQEFELSHSQRGLWFIQQMNPESVAYNEHYRLKITGALDFATFQQTLGEIIERHAIMRTVFVERDGHPKQRVLDELAFELPLIDVTNVKDEEIQTVIEKALHQDLTTPFDLSKGPLFRYQLFQRGEQEFYFCMVMHHIIIDGLSAEVLFREMSAIYSAKVQDLPINLPAMEVQYADFAQWQKEQLETPKFRKMEAYWVENLSKPLPVLDLPTDFPRPLQNSDRGAIVNYPLSESLTQQLLRVSEQTNSSLFMVMLSAYFVWLQRMTSEEDLIVGTPFTGRTEPEMQNLMGYFVNTMPIRVHMDGAETFQDVLNRVRVRLLGAMANQEYPFDMLVEAVNPERDSSRPVLNSTLFDFQIPPTAKMEGLELELMNSRRVSSISDMIWNVLQKQDHLHLDVGYNVTLFKQETVERFISQYEGILQAVVQDINAPIRQLEILTAYDRELYAEVNATEVEYDLDHLLIDAFVEQAEAHPERVALIYEGQTMTYGELHERSNRLAHFLRAQGVQRNQLVGIMMERGFELMVGFYGIIKSGAAYVPIDPEYPAERIEYMLEDSGAYVLLTKQAYLDSVPKVSTVLLLEEDLEKAPESFSEASVWRDLAEFPTTMPEPVNAPTDLAYMIYTSGSTGQPKGVQIQHKAILNRLYWHQDTFQGTPDDVAIQRTTMCFDPSVIELFWPLRHGASLSIMPQDTVLDPKRLIAQLKRDGATYMQFVPSLLSVVVAALQEMPADDRPHLRAIITSGEALPANTVQQWFEMFPGSKLANLYGPTEAAVDVTHVIYEAGTAKTTIGKPVSNTQVYVLNEAGQLCSVNVKGELYIGGAQLGVGYHNKPDKTAEAFVPNHLEGTPGDRLYRTGDAVRLLPDGNIEYLGRNDDQVKIRGMRMELGEIESALMQHDAIQKAVVTVHEAAPGDKRLVAYVVLDGAHSEDVAQWQEHLRERVPSYMVPSAFVVLETLPLTPNGKVNRRALPKPDASAFRQEEYVEPRTAMEEIVAGVWADVLHAERIGANENFFAVGGHSLLATQVMSRLAGACGVEVPLRALFEVPTVAELAAHIERLQQEQKDGKVLPLERVSREQTLPLSFAQQRLWVLDRFMSEEAVYNMCGAMRIQGPVNADALERAIGEIVARHEVLRTTFAEVDGEPVQVIADSVTVLEHADLSACPVEEREEQFNRLMQEEAHRPFDLAVGPMVRFKLVRFADDQYALLLNFHHIIYDGWSIDVLFNEMEQLYTAFVAGEASPLAPLKVQYADYAVWQRQWLEGGVMDQQLDYWKGKLAALPVLELPTDHPRPPVQTYNGKTERFTFTKELTDKLQALSQGQGATMYMTLLAAFQSLLARYSGQEDIVVGTTIAGRQRRELEDMIGFFVNTLVMRTDLTGAATFREVLDRVRSTALEAYAHQDVPFEKLVEELQPERDMSRSALFQVMFELQNTPLGDMKFGDLKVNLVEAEAHIAKFDLMVTMVEQGGVLGGAIEYNTDLFDTPTIERMIGHFRNLLEGIAANPEAPIGEMDILTEQDRVAYAALNDTDADYDLNHLLIDAFVEQAEAHPERTALIYEGRTMTYGELHERSNRLAHFLREKGVQRNQLVALMMERSMEMMVGFYGIQKSGGAYVPIDPLYPPERIQYMLADSGAHVLLTKQEYLDAMPDVSTVLLMDEELTQAPEAVPQAVIWRDLADQPATMPEPVNDPSDLAYMIYTSGSTGQPKGVLIQHTAILNRLHWHQDTFQCTPDDVVIQRTTMCFDDSVIELFWPLRHGAALSIMSQDVVLDPKRMIEQLNRDGATYMQFVPSLLSVVVTAMQELPVEERPKLRAIIVSGEALPPSLVQSWFDLFPGTQMANLYGPTEAAVDVTGAIYEAPTTQITIGKPTTNTQIYVLDARGQLCPVNVKGELYVGGVQLGVGYHNKPEKTAEAFVPNHLEGTPGDRLYRTGDAVRLLPDGNIEYLGRNDDQVKIRGMRIELGEIESALVLNEMIREAVVVVHDVDGDKRLAAYLVLDGEQPTDASLYQAYLRERVPAYMVPSAFVVLESMPLTPNGKVDRKALPKPDPSAFHQEEYVAPRTAVEGIVAEVWADVLRREKVGAFDNFFEAGGHSLLATQVMSRLAAACSVQVPLKVLFEAPTVAELAAHIERLQGEQLSDEWIPLERVSRDQALPLSFAQQRLWVLDRLMDGGAGASYNVFGAMRLQGPLNAAAFEQALHELIDRHEVLRTTFAEVNGEPVQVIADSLNVLETIDLRAWPLEEREEQLNRVLDEEAQRPFDLAVGPLVRFTLAQVKDDEQVLIANYHHIIFDGWSIDIVFNELRQLYTAFAAGEPSPLAPLDLQYADYSVWQRQWLQGDVLNNQLAYWSNKLSDLPVLQLPTDRQRPPVQTYNGRTESFVLTKELTDALQRLSQEQGATLYMTLLGAFQTLLARYSSQEDIVIGTPIAGRHRQELEELIGFFVNTLVMRTDLSGEPSFREVLNRVRETALEAYAHQDVPFEKLVEELQPDRDLSRSPLFQVMFALQNTPLDGPQFGDLNVSMVEVENHVSKFDLTLNMVEQSGVLHGGIEYNTDLFDQETIERMVGHFRTLLEGIAANAETPIHLLPILTGPEQNQLLIEWNDTAEVCRRGMCVQQLVEEQVEKRPDNIALRFEDKHLTYRELNERANRVAHRLQKLGVGPDMLVGLMVERSLEMAVGMLAIVKAGGAYVPLDPSYPTDRLTYMLEDSNVAVLLTQEALVAQLPVQPAQVLCFDRDRAAIEAEPATNPSSPVTENNLMYMIYTSGSTGKPKGVQIEHKAFVNFVCACRDHMRVVDTDVMIAVFSVSFDPAAMDCFLPLSNGATMVIASREETTDGVQLAALADRVEATVMMATPSTWNMLVQTGWPGRPNMRMLAGGEGFPRELINALLERSQEVWNAYGPTEATIAVTMAKMEAGNGTVYIGRPFANTTAYVLDKHLQLVPVGVAGELYVGGRQLARGYFNRQDLTEAAFLPHPFAEGEGERIYKTGDLVRYHADGQIEHLGRVDGQVKVRGYRIELGEIEAVLMKHESIVDAAVVVHEVAKGDKRLAAYLVIDGEEDVKSWKSHLRERLPAFMMPSAFVVLEALPVTPNGKVDRKALPMPESFSTGQEEYVAPRTAVEETVAEIWAAILRLERVGINDNFFEAGGHSLLATQVLARLAGACSVQVPLKALFEAPTVAELAAHIESLQQEQSDLPVIPLERASREEPLPLSFAQQRLWVLDRLISGGASYNIPGAMRLQGSLNVEALEQAIGEIVARHEVLRTTFAEVDGEPVQVIADWSAVLEKFDVSASPSEDREEQINRIVQEEVQRPFDLAVGPLVRFSLVRMADDEHMLISNFHHIVFDGWSMDVLFQELRLLYTAFAAGEKSPLAPLSIQYADYAVWQRKWLEGDVLNGQLAYWKDKLSDLTVLELPTDRPRPPVQTQNGSSEHFELPRELTDALQGLSQGQGATLYMTLLGAFQTLLARYSGQDDIVVGTPIAGRHRGNVEELIGFFVNTLVMRTDLSGAPTFREVLNRVRDTALDAYAHQDVPFEKLVEELQPERDMSRSPLFQVMFALQNTQLEQPEFADLQVNLIDPESQVAKFDLQLSMWEQAGVLRGSIEYNTDLFDAATIARMNGHFRTLLEGIAANPELPIDQLPILTQQEQHQLLVEWNDTATDYPRDGVVHQLFEEQVERTPDAIAVTFEGRALTYRELNERANRLAHFLRKQGVQADSLVGVCVERSLEMVVALVGILKAGGAYVPIDPNYPTERFLHLLEDSQVGLLLTLQHLVDKLPANEATVFALDSEWERIAGESAENLPCDVTATSLAYVNYTSGSTGKPKGVAIPHRAVARLVKETNFMSFSEDEVFLQFASISFDAATLEIWGPLLNGGRLAVFPAHMPSLAELGQVVREEGITALWLTAGLFHQMVDGQLEDLRGVRQLLAGGDALSVAHVKKVLEQLPDTLLINGYGPTENTTFTTCYPVQDANKILTSVPIGRPISNTRVYVLDRNMQPVPIGVPGELYIGGDGLAREYLNQPERTEESFVPSSFAADERLYKTGDWVRWLPDGTVEFLGRIDNQVKIRGFRIELGEIESMLVQHESVQDALVIVHEVTPGDKRLTAYVVLEAEASADVKLWREYLRDNLPSFMVPSAFVVLDAMPLTPNGKVDRKALPLPDASAFIQEEYVAPRTALEATVAEIWSDVLRVEQIGAYDNFFEAGGHSLLATQVMSRLAAACSVQVPLKALFEAPTVAELAAHIERLQEEQQGVEIIPLERASREQSLPLSFAQQRLWVLDRLISDGGASYTIPGAMRLQGVLNTDALERALQDILLRHEVLRTTFAEVDEEPVQVIADSTAMLDRIDLSAFPADEREEQVARLLQEEAQCPFDLTVGPLVRMALVRVADEEHVLIMNFHHIIFDGWSMEVLFNELVQLYTAFAAGEESPLSPLPIQYADYSVWQRQWLEGDVLNAQLAYWSEKLAALPVLQLPTDRPRPAVQTHNGRTENFALTQELTEALQALSQQHGATLYMTLLGAFQTLLARYSGQEDIVVGTPIAGRNRREIEELIGFFVNTLVMRTDLSGEPSFREVLDRVRETALEAYAHQDVPFEKLVEELQPERDMSRSPLFQVMFVLQNTPLSEPEFADLKVELVEAELPVAKFDLTLTMTEQAGVLLGGIEYNTDLYDEATIKRMAGHFRTLLEAIVANPETAVHQLPILTEPERHQLLVEWNATDADYPQGLTAHQLFEAQVEQTPDNLAVTCEGKSLTYRELNEQANRVAHRLQKLGVGPDVLVGVMFERSVEMVVGILAALKAGGAYLPLDPSYPSERLTYLLEDSQVPVLLTQEALVAELDTHQAHVLCFDRDRAELAAEPTTNPSNAATADNLMYVIYTSGSTGKPKGVQIEHSALVNFLHASQEFLHMQASDVLVSVTSIAFDPTVIDLFLPLVNGATVVVASRDTATDGVQLAALLDAANATIMQATPATWNMLLQTGWKGRKELRIMSGGDAFPRDVINALAERTQGVINAYGPTEATIISTSARMEVSNEPVHIGRPLSNTTAYILDKHLQPVPVGVAGELYVGGRQLARGYLNRPDLTAAAFLPHPFAEGERLYKTGDLARYLSNGFIEHMGRADNQVKIRGYRIELGEIESVLMQHESILDAAVVVHEVAAGDKRLAAYLVIDGEADVKVWKAHLRDRLPTFMMPSAFVVLETMPLTPNGKVDRNALPMPETFGTASEEYVAPRTALEETVAAIWADVLRAEQIGVNDNFFEAGGHSLLATQVLSRLAGACSVQVPLKALFEAPTVAELSLHIERLQQEQSGLDIIPLERVSREEPLPLSFAQQRLWVLDRLMSGGTAYNMPGAMRLQGALNADALEQALHEVIDRHEVLRTTFAEVDGEPVQVIAESSLVLEKADLRSFAAEEREELVNRLLQEEAQHEFDLTVGPLVRFTLVQIADDEHVLISNFHHIVFDGWSMDVLSQELLQLYTAFASGEKSPLAPLAVQYADYAVWQRNWLEGDVLNGQLAYWNEKLAALPVLQLPTDRPRPAVQTHTGSTVRFELTKGLTDALQGLSQQQGATMYMTLLGAFQTLLARYSGQEDIVVGTPIAGRHHREIEELIGFFVNTLVMRTDLTDAANFLEVLNRVRDTALGAYANQDVPFEKLVEQLQPERDMSRTPLFQVMFVMQNTAATEPMFGDLKATPVEQESQVAKFDLTLTMWEESGVLYGGIEYNTDLFDASTIERMSGHFRTLLEGIAANPQLPVHELPILTEQEQHQLLVEWNATGADYPQDLTAHELFQAQVEKTPDNLAVTCEGRSLTYRELNEQANRVAHRLQKLGVGPDVLVGVMFERSVEMVVGILAALKAGGAYLPLDPSYPAERLTYLLEDSQVPVLLTQEALVADLDVQKAQVLCFDRDQAEIAAESAANPTNAATPDSLMYVIYTSGSTGKPKGVQIQHSALVNFLFASQEFLHMQASDVLVSVTSISFDPTVIDLFLPLVNGATVVVASREVASDGLQLAALLDEANATIMQATPVTYNMLLQTGWQGRSELRIMSGGDAFPREVINALAERTQGVINAYGPTEATIISTAARMEVSDEPVHIGRPLSNTTAYILDKHLQPVPVGVAGELYVGGRQLARGYLNRPELTEAAFLPHPFADGEGERIYKTGDLARYRADGKIEHLGRVDGQVKLRGYRIELGEIESVLMHHESIQEAVVLVHEVAPGDKRLIAYLVLDDEQTADVKVWKTYLRDRLPTFMVPSAFVVMETMPLTPNGKVDRQALTEERNYLLDTGAERVAPRDSVELRMMAIWERVLGTAEFGVRDNFFEIGGHSLLAVRLMAELQNEFSAKLPLSSLYQEGTIEHLADLLRSEGGADRHASLVPIQVRESGLAPIYLVHPAFGFVQPYIELARMLGDRSVYGLQSKGLYDDQEPLTTIEDMAAFYIEEIRSVQSEGPYQIAGWSVGGVIAIEMALQLQRQGERVSYLGLLDTILMTKEAVEDESVYQQMARQEFRGGLMEYLGEGAGDVELPDGIDAMTVEEEIQWFVERARTLGISAPGLEIEQVTKTYHVMQNNILADRKYILSGKVEHLYLYKAEEQEHEIPATIPWSDIAESIDTIAVPGNHQSMARAPHVSVLAEKMRQSMEGK